mmetsp:Transcript_21228/g.53970  ORF Transcript_21228/g.53970 Transcript_21228/m.53970 type:complete len:635 (-) Transcript_21228:754-2658(-)
MLDIQVTAVGLPRVNPHDPQELARFEHGFSSSGAACVSVQVLTATWYGAKTKQTRRWCQDSYVLFSCAHDSARVRVKWLSPLGKLLKSKAVAIDKHASNQHISCTFPDGTAVQLDLRVAGDSHKVAGKRGWWSMLFAQRPRTSHQASREPSSTSPPELQLDSHTSSPPSEASSSQAPALAEEASTSSHAVMAKRQRTSKSGRFGWLKMFARSSKDSRHSTDGPASHNSEGGCSQDQMHDDLTPQAPPSVTQRKSLSSQQPAQQATGTNAEGGAPAVVLPSRLSTSRPSSRTSAHFAVCDNPLFGEEGVASPRTPAATTAPAAGQAPGAAPCPVEPERVQQALQQLERCGALMGAAKRDELREALAELAANSHEGMSADPSWARAVFESVLLQLAACDVGAPDADGFYTRTVQPRSQNGTAEGAAPSCSQPLVLKMAIADTDQAALGAEYACTCISMLLAQSVLQQGEGCVLDMAHFGAVIRQGAQLWHELCADEDIAASHPGGLLDFVTVVQRVPAVADRFEAQSVIGAEASTLAECVRQCMTQPGPYLLTVAGHTTCAVLMGDGRVAWANSLAGSLAPGGTVCLFGSAAAWAGAVVALNTPTSGAGTSVAAELHGLQREGASKVPVQFHGFFP